MVEMAIKLSPSFESASVAQLVNVASRYKSRVSLVADEKTANAKSLMGIISLEMQSGNTVKLVADGEDEQSVLPEIEHILSGKA